MVTLCLAIAGAVGALWLVYLVGFWRGVRRGVKRGIHRTIDLSLPTMERVYEAGKMDGVALGLMARRGLVDGVSNNRDQSAQGKGPCKPPGTN